MSFTPDFHTAIDDQLPDDATYLITFSKPWDVSDESFDSEAEYDADYKNKVHHFVGQGVDGALRALAWTMDQMEDFSTTTSLVESALNRQIRRKADLPQEIEQIRLQMAQAQDGELRYLRSKERDAMRALENIDEVIASSELDLRFYNIARAAVEAAKSGSLDVSIPVDEDILREIPVPDHETRRTLGAFIYYFVLSQVEVRDRELVIRPVRMA